ncbi:large neutral amino acids transporter small subunit 2-like [Tubulanus polymorphus]|uniref:large neutral amino acids transporter small subunit 2-like n=1 Tax=Tubulanus polymorphus TaxID=672921 RepID=UPI003DA53B2E
MVNMKYFTPIPALLIMGLFSSLMLVSSNVYELLNYLEFVDCVGIVVPVVGLLIYRWKEPDWERPIKVWLIVPVLFTLVSIYLIVLPVITRPFQTLIGMALILTTGVPIYLLMKKEKKWSKDGRIQNFLDKIVLLIQKSLLVVPEENESSS